MDSHATTALWCLGTISHFLLTARWVSRAGSGATRDERWFQVMVIAIATLSLALHAVASTTGLALTPVLVLLLAGHAAAWRLLADRAPSPPVPEPGIVTRALEGAAMLMIAAVAIQWVIAAVPTTEVSGSDAAHYHVPYAVNLALGTSPFDLPPTPHLYPMGSSMLAAWFILPLQTNLLTDLVMALPFLLLVSAAGWLFRQLTSASGLAWSTWPMLALFGTPLFRSASLMSADLLFAAAAMAFAAALIAPLTRRQLTTMDTWLIAWSLGLLLGSKITGIVVAALLGAPALLAALFLRQRGAWTQPIRPHVWAGAALAVVGAGGIWLVRNWWIWGSPVAPNGLTLFGITIFPGANFEATTYNSMLGDMASTATYDLWARTRHFTDQWLGRWYLSGLGLTLLVPLDAAIGWRRGAPRPLLTLRLCISVLAFGTAAVMATFLIGAPWTSLEWTKGLSLRYGIPWLAWLPVVAWAGLFPAGLPWYRRPRLALIGGVAMIAAGLKVFSGHDQPLFPPVPTLGGLVAAAVACSLVKAAGRASGRGLIATAVIVLGISMGFGNWIGRADMRARESRTMAMVTGPRTEGEQLYDAALQIEERDGLSCTAGGRRFFITTRLDEPLALQGARHTNRVFFAGRDVTVTATVRPAMGTCDYIISDRGVLGTDKGAALHAALNASGRLVEVSTLNGLVLLAHR